MRKITNMNFDWRFSPKKDAMILSDYDESNMTLINIPHSNVELPFSNFSESLYQFESVYRKHFVLDKKHDHHYFIKFYGVSVKATVMINGIVVGEHMGGYTPFKFEITKEVKDGENLIVVLVDSKENINIPPFGKTVDYLTYGGIYREIELIETGSSYIEDLKLKVEDLLTDQPKLFIELDHIDGHEVQVDIKEKNKIVTSKSFNVNETLLIEYQFKLWGVDTPNIYDIIVTLDHSDQIIIPYGFRVSEFRKDGFYLNGEHVKIIGQNRHQIYPYVGYAMPKSVEEKDAKILKSIGNAVRTSHYPQSKHFIEACDRLGLLVFMEAPGWQYIGDDQWKESYKQQMIEMIKYYKHHPSIILWGVRVNESNDDHELYDQTNKLSKMFDERQTGGVRCFSFSEPLEDVYTYNDFFHNGMNNYLKDMDEVIDHDKPYLITEYNGHMFPTKSFDSPIRLIEHAMRHAHILNAVLGDGRISGSFGWNMIDYYTHQEFGSADHVCYHGIYDQFRLPKPAAKVYESQYATKPYLEVLHGVDIGDFDQSYIDKIYIASNCEYIEVYQDTRYVGKFEPRFDIFPYLKHPLYILDDLYGDAYEKHGYDEETAKKAKAIAHEIAHRGGKDKITKYDNFDYKLLDIGWNMYGKYVANWGSKMYTYTFVGHFDDQKITQKVGPYSSYDYDIKLDTDILYHHETYDATRIVIKAIDDLGQLKPYCFDAMTIDTEGPLEIIGDKVFSLIGGKRAVWIKSTGIGNAKVVILTKHKNVVLDLQIKG